MAYGKRHKLGGRHSRHMFTKHSGTHVRNMPHRNPMRGGIRL